MTDDTTFMERHIVSILGVLLAVGAAFVVVSHLTPVLASVSSLLR